MRTVIAVPAGRKIIDTPGIDGVLVDETKIAFDASADEVAGSLAASGNGDLLPLLTHTNEKGIEIRYTPQGVRVEMTAEQLAGEVEPVTVEPGPGPEPEDKGSGKTQEFEGGPEKDPGSSEPTGAQVTSPADPETGEGSKDAE